MFSSLIIIPSPKKLRIAYLQQADKVLMQHLRSCVSDITCNKFACLESNGFCLFPTQVVSVILHPHSNIS